MTLSREQLQRIKDRYCPCADCEGACDDILDEAAMEGVIAVMDWIKRNAIYSHSPTKEHIVIDRSDWNKLIVGLVPPDHPRITFGEADTGTVHWSTLELTLGCPSCLRASGLTECPLDREELLPQRCRAVVERMKAVKEGFKLVECERCDGCGWYEGGEYLQTVCEDCNGTGAVEVRT